MPTYQYACTECGHAFEAVQSFTDDALTDCPECTGRLRKVFNSVGIVFKGSGFYRTDSREKPAAGDKAEKGTTDAPAAKADSPAAKEPAAPKPKQGATPAAGTSSGTTSSASTTSGSAA